MSISNENLTYLYTLDLLKNINIELTILNSKHQEVKEFLRNEGYEGDFITIRKKEGVK